MLCDSHAEDKEANKSPTLLDRSTIIDVGTNASVRQQIGRTIAEAPLVLLPAAPVASQHSQDILFGPVTPSTLPFFQDPRTRFSLLRFSARHLPVNSSSRATSLVLCCTRTRPRILVFFGRLLLVKKCNSLFPSTQTPLVFFPNQEQACRPSTLALALFLSHLPELLLL